MNPLLEQLEMGKFFICLFFLLFFLTHEKKNQKKNHTLFKKKKKIQVQQEPQMGWICSPDLLSTYIYIAPDCKNMIYNFIKVVI